MDLKEEKRAVVFGGGGARGSYEIGVWKALDEIGFHPQVVVGTSVGSLNACLMAQGSLEKAVDAWEVIDSHGIFSVDLPENLSTPAGTKSALGSLALDAVKGGGVGYEPLSELLDDYVHEEDVRASSIEFGLLTTRMRFLQATPKFIEDIPEGRLKEYLLASCACFPAMKAYTIDDTQYIDGGYSDNVPIGMALDKGATEIVAVDLKSPGLLPHHSIPQGVNVIRVNRLWDLGQLFLFDRARARRNNRLGYLETKKAFGLLDGHRYSFEKDTFKNLSEGAVGERARKILYQWRCFGLLFPEIHSTSINENRVMDTTKNLLDKTAAEAQNVESYLLAGAEALAQQYKVSPLPIYTIEQFNQAIVLMDDQSVPESGDSATIMASEIELFFGNSQNSRQRNLSVMKNIKEKLETNENPTPREISRMENMYLPFPMEFLEALFAVSSGLPLEKKKKGGK